MFITSKNKYLSNDMEIFGTRSIPLTLFAQLTYVNVLHWIVGLYYYGFLVNEGIGLILIIHTFYPSTLSVEYMID